VELGVFESRSRTPDSSQFLSLTQSVPKTPAGVEPAVNCFAGSRHAVWLQRQSVARRSGERRDVSVSKSSGRGLRHQKRPDFRQHCLNRLPLPHGQRSLRPSFSSSSLSPWTRRMPRFTLVSDGKPLRRLLIVSKKMRCHQGFRCT
jgi:hypothetical protein